MDANTTHTTATIRLSGPADDVNSLIVLAVTSGLCESCEITGDLPLPRQRHGPTGPVHIFQVGERVESRGLNSNHKLARGQQGTVCHVRDLGARGYSLNVEWDDGVDRQSVGSSILVPVPDATV